jgi:hypothetical protein
MPFARTSEDEAERWLRVLRLNGQVGATLQALGVSEGPLRAAEETEREQRGAPTGLEDRDAVARVTEDAVRIAGRRDAARVTTSDVLMAVMHVYGADFEEVLRAHGTDAEEVIERLGLLKLDR